MNEMLSCSYAPRRPALAAVLIALVIPLGVLQAAAPGQGRVAVSAATDSRVVFRVDVGSYEIEDGLVDGTRRISVPGFVPRGEPGQPSTPTRQFLVALPPEGNYSVSWRVIESADLGAQRLEPVPFPVGIRDDDLGPLLSQRHVFEPDVYDAFTDPPLVEALETAFIRKQRALPLLVNPLSFDPASGQATLATSVEITVTFAPAPRRTAPPARSALWRSTFARMFVNAGQASQWGRPPGIERSPGPAPRAVAQGTRVKLRVYDTGVHRVVASEAAAAGFPAGQSIPSLHMFRRTYDDDALSAGIQDVAFTVSEGATGTAGVFDADDVLVFYGRNLRDDIVQDDRIRKYSDYNVYWLGTTSGPTMSTRSVAPGFVTADTASASFPVMRHFETDFYFNEGSPLGITDFYYANFGSSPGPIDESFTVGAIKPGTALALRAQMIGDRYLAPRLIRLSMVNSKGTTVLSAFESIPNKQVINFEAQTPAANVVTGPNTFRMERPDASRGGVEVLLNWVQVTYESLYRAESNTLAFNTATLSGDTSITVTGLDDTDVWLLDVTDPDAPVRCTLDAGNFVTTADGFALSFRETILSRTDYVMAPVDEMTEITAADIDLDVPSTLVGNSAESGVDVLVVSNGLFISRMQEWVTYRRAQGYRVLMADVVDVYDEFNNGVPHARAIDRFVRHFYELGDAGALLLVGDSSEDNKSVEDGAGPNLVPSHSWPDHVGVLNEDEVVTTDKRYVKMPGPSGIVDRYPDLMVGRLPVASDIELQRVLAKIFAFEQPRADDFWRKRMIVIADDAYSEGGSVFGGSQFCFFGSETPFETGQEVFASTIESAPPAGYDVVRFYLSEYTEEIHQDPCIGRLAAIDYVRSNVNPLLMNELAQGATLVTIQAHMNRSLVTHEKLLSTESGSLLGGAGRDHLRMDNRDKPYIIFGLGCHFSDYALHKELVAGRLISNSPNGDAFAEQLLFANNSAAVGTYGSSGYEYLGQTNLLMRTTGRVWFYDAPYDTMVNQTRAEWVFGQLMFLVENEAASSQPNAVERYHILGDPLLRIDAGPPAFDVTVDGASFQSGDVVTTGGASGDTVRVVAVITDENAIRDFGLTIDGQDRTSDLTIEQLLDPGLPAGRQYRVSFAHKLEPRTYDIVMQALQAPDTSGSYQMAGEFLLKVESSVTLSVNGRVVQSGETIPAQADFLVELSLPVVVPEDSVSVTLDDVPVSDAVLSHPASDDSTTWLIRFSRSLPDGTHELVVRAGAPNIFRYSLVVSSAVGLRHVMNYPNPFTDVTSFVYTNDVEISDGRIDIFTLSGKRIRRIDIPPDATAPGENTVFWDGRDQAGGSIANGVYLYVITVTQRGGSSTTRGKVSRIE